MSSDVSQQYHITERGAERMLRLAEFLDMVPRDQFDFSTTREEKREGGAVCGTVGCAIGWAPNALPDCCSVRNGSSFTGCYSPVFSVNGVEVTPSHCIWSDVAEKLFDISESDAIRLFTPWNRAPHDGSVAQDNASPKTVAKRLRDYVAWAKVTPFYHPSNADDAIEYGS